MKSADKMRRLFNSAAVQTNAAPDDAVFEKIKTVYTRTVECKSAQQEPKMWRFVMKSPSAKLAAAAAVIIACVIGLSLWRTTGSGIALADVLAQIEKVRSVRSQVSYKITGGDPNKPYNIEMRSTSLTSQENGSKYSTEALDPNGEWSEVSERYDLPQKKTEILIYPKEKIYLCKELEDAQVEQIQQDARDPLGILKAILQTKYESLGRPTIDGVEVAGFRSKLSVKEITIGTQVIGEGGDTRNVSTIDIKIEKSD